MKVVRAGVERIFHAVDRLEHRQPADDPGNRHTLHPWMRVYGLRLCRCFLASDWLYQPNYIGFAAQVKILLAGRIFMRCSWKIVICTDDP
jgi:hypothetical protein